MATCPVEMLHLPESNFLFLRTSLSITDCLLAEFFPQVSALGDMKMGSSSQFWGPLTILVLSALGLMQVPQGDCLLCARVSRGCLW